MRPRVVDILPVLVLNDLRDVFLQRGVPTEDHARQPTRRPGKRIEERASNSVPG